MLPSPLDEPDLDLSLPHTYQVEDSFELPGSGESDIPRVYIPSPVNRMEHAGTWLNIRASSGFMWTGVFAYGLGGPSGCSRIMSSPDPERVIIISRGAAYLVKANDPYSAVLLPITPVTDARPIAKLQLVLFVSFSSLFAYGFDDLVWTSDFGVDDLRLIRVDDDRIEVQGYDPSSGQTVAFAVNFKTGASHSL